MKSLKITEKFDPSSHWVFYHGDVRNLSSTIPDWTVKLVITSPPYNIGKNHEKKTDIASCMQEQKQVIRECVRICHPSGSISVKIILIGEETIDNE